MKKIILALALLFSANVALAQHHHGYYHRHYHSSARWVAPVVIGGFVGYALAQPRVIYVPPPVVYPAPVVTAPIAPAGYHYENVLDQNCNCYRLVLIPNY